MRTPPPQVRSPSPRPLAAQGHPAASEAATAPASTLAEGAAAVDTRPENGPVDRMEGARAVVPSEAEKNAQTMTAFYDAFARHDGKAMASFYADDAVFHDPAFGDLKGKEIGAMWMMLTESAPSLKVKASNIRGDDKGASGHWDADYTFSATGRPVHNSIDARFELRDGKIVSHKDDFSFQKWAEQALPLGDFGWIGRKLAGSGLTQRLLRHFARKGLDDYMDKHGIR